MDTDAADNCHLYVTTMDSMNFQDVILPIPIDRFKDRSVLVTDLTPMQHAAQHYQYPQKVGEPLSLEQNFTLPQENGT